MELALFLGRGSGYALQTETGIVLARKRPRDRLTMTSDLLIALYVGPSLPVVGAGIALNQGASPPNTVLGFAILVGLGVSVSSWALLRRRTGRSEEGV
jgi:hypothetical protein